MCMLKSDCLFFSDVEERKARVLHAQRKARVLHALSLGLTLILHRHICSILIHPSSRGTEMFKVEPEI